MNRYFIGRIRISPLSPPSPFLCSASWSLGSQLRLLRRQLDEAEATKAQVHAEMAAVRSQKEAAELERHKLMLAHQSETAALHVKVGGQKQGCSTQPRRPPTSSRVLVAVLPVRAYLYVCTIRAGKKNRAGEMYLRERFCTFLCNFPRAAKLIHR